VAVSSPWSNASPSWCETAVSTATKLRPTRAVFGTWLEETRSCGVPAVETFATGLQQDQAAVEAVLTMPWSSGQAEGQINKLKLIKRQM
jgi:hypothetical protein